MYRCSIVHFDGCYWLQLALVRFAEQSEGSVIKTMAPACAKKVLTGLGVTSASGALRTSPSVCPATVRRSEARPFPATSQESARVTRDTRAKRATSVLLASTTIPSA